MFDYTRTDRPFLIAVAGTSKIKINAAQNAVNELELHATVNGVHIDSSGVNEQPYGIWEGQLGARNRAMSAYSADPRFDVYLGIESFIRDDGPDINIRYWDIACICTYIPSVGLDRFTYSDPCEFPSEAVKETNIMDGGFTKNTVGKTLANKGLVLRHDDPHYCLSGKHRVNYIKNAIIASLNDLEYFRQI